MFCREHFTKGSTKVRKETTKRTCTQVTSIYDVTSDLNINGSTDILVYLSSIVGMFYSDILDRNLI